MKSSLKWAYRSEFVFDDSEMSLRDWLGPELDIHYHGIMNESTIFFLTETPISVARDLIAATNWNGRWIYTPGGKVESSNLRLGTLASFS